MTQRSIPIPPARYVAEPDPFPEPRCAFCGAVVLIGDGHRNWKLYRQALHNGFIGTLAEYLVEQKRAGDKVLYTHAVCGRPERP